MNILIGTANKGKIEGISQAFSLYFSDVNIFYDKVSSDVSEQSFDEDILKGAKNRISNLKNSSKNIDIDFYVSSESGIVYSFDSYININLVLIMDKDGNYSIGTSSGFVIPNKYIGDVKKFGLGNLMDKLFDGDNLGNGKGGIRHLTKGNISRIDMVREACIMALTSFINNDIWRD